MSFKIGDITLPMMPTEVQMQLAKDFKGVGLLVRAPLVLDFGPKTPVLTLKGYLAEPGHTVEDLETDYWLPLAALLTGGAVFPSTIWDDNVNALTLTKSGSGSNDWNLTAIASSPTPAYGKKCFKLVRVAGSYDYARVSRNYATNRDWSKQKFVTWWYYGQNSAQTFKCSIWAPDSSNRFEFSFVDDFTGWRRFLKKQSEFSSVGSPSWSTINSVGLEPFRSTGTPFIFDKACAGACIYVDGPGTRYDGLYYVANFTPKEKGGFVLSFEYTMELWKVDDYF